MSIFHVRLKELKNESAQPQSKIAADLGLTPQAFSYYINGREPNFEILIKISKYFNVTADYLLGLSSSKSGADDAILKEIEIEDSTIKVLKADIDKRLYNRFVQHPYYSILSSYISICLYFNKHEPLRDDYNSLEEWELDLLKKMFHIYDVLFATPSFPLMQNIVLKMKRKLFPLKILILLFEYSKNIFLLVIVLILLRLLISTI